MTKEDFVSGAVESLLRSYTNLRPKLNLTTSQEQGWYDYNLHLSSVGLAVSFVEEVVLPPVLSALQPLTAYPYPDRYKNKVVIEVVDFEPSSVKDHRWTIPLADLSLLQFTKCLDLITTNCFSNSGTFSIESFRTIGSSLRMPFSYERL